MAQFDKISSIKIGTHVFEFTDPQVVEWERDGDDVVMRATLRIKREFEELTAEEYNKTILETDKHIRDLWKSKNET